MSMWRSFTAGSAAVHQPAVAQRRRYLHRTPYICFRLTQCRGTLFAPAPGSEYPRKGEMRVEVSFVSGGDGWDKGGGGGGCL
jgi:hypothetical protein